ncbi:hypothetical protein BSL82_05335 [Tardibacter chloracetimidivorans]|uniref:histidine kinase n=1 Tax=Tardibacter chloracetimidivorans TaxID=1921510 RepID=A0A1L3ZT40_9SPHN|nr:CHASE domain-containing protein [Tardibacter chloracetimidivorans]API58801.1 hypothetical protein BSL82_05335 [Tardibacter chloracetimidivorans]
MRRWFHGRETLTHNSYVYERQWTRLLGEAAAKGYRKNVKPVKIVKALLADQSDFLLRYRRVLPAAVLSLTLLLALGFGLLLTRYVERQERAMLRIQVVELASGIEQRMNASEALLRASATAFAFVPRIDADFFSSYFKGLQLDVASRGMIAMGWTAPVGRDRLHELETMMRSEGDDDFFTWPVTSEKQIYPVLYLEPQNPVNHSAIGFNAYSDSARRAAMVRAFDAGAPRATAPTVLRQEGWETDPTGFLVYAPVHDAISSARREAPSRRSFKGFIFGVFRAEDLIRTSIPADQAQKLDLELYDITGGRRRLLYDSRPEMWSARSVDEGNRTTLVVSGRRWELVVAPVSAWEYRDLPQRLLIYFLIGTAVVVSCLLAGIMWFAMRAAAATREALDRETEQVEMRTILLRELNHRVKNTLATVNSLAALSREGATDVASYYAALNGRLRALSATHDLLTSSDWGDTELRDIAEAELAPFMGVKGQIVIEGPPVRFEPTKALSLGLSLHELATNASKYGALSTITGQVFLNWHFDRENRLHLRWAESGGPAIVEDRKQGFGSMLVEKLMARQLKADVKLSFPPTGAVCEFVIPLDKQKGAAER